MRKKRWIAPFWGMLAGAAFGQAASAQVSGGPLDASFPPVGPGMAPGPVDYAANPTYTPIAPDAASPAGYPPGGMEAWPTISPFDNAFDQTYNQDGIWFREILGHNRKYRIDVDFISGKFRQPGNAIVGHDVIRGLEDSVQQDEALQQADFPFPQRFIGVKQFLGRESRGRYFNSAPADDIPAVFGLPQRLAVPLLVTLEGTITGDGDDGFPIDLTYPLPRTGLAPVVNLDGSDTIDEDELSNTNLYVVSGGVLAEDSVPRLGGFDAVIQQRSENPSSPGLRLVFGLEDEDQSGFDWGGWWLHGEAAEFRRGTDDPRRLRANGVVLFDLGQLPTETGFDRDLVEVLDYNQSFSLTHESTAAGTDLAFYHTPFVDYGWLQMRPLYGARYNYVREQFNFTGRDSGQFVVFASDGSPTAISDTEFAFVDPETVYDLFPYETSVTSEVQSHLYGPQLGMDMKMGGEYFTINSAVKTGIVANTERLNIDGHGFGSTEAITGRRVFFEDAKSHTRVAPFVEFNANADLNVFPLIPYVNRWSFFKNARVNLGWTSLVVGNLQRPMDQIVYRSELIGGPYIKERGRDAWYMQNWNAGVHWKF